MMNLSPMEVKNSNLCNSYIRRYLTILTPESRTGVINYRKVCNINSEMTLRNKYKDSENMNIVHTGNTFCHICGSKETIIRKRRAGNIPSWFRYKIDKDGDFNTKGKWDGKSYICNKCYNKVQTLKDERVCSICGSKSNSSYCKIYDEQGNWDENSWECAKCHSEKYNEKIVKPTRPCRNNGISKDSTLGKGVIGEAIISKALNIETCSKAVNNFSYKFDMVRHNIYGRIQVKIASPYLDKRNGNDKYKFDFRHGKPCDCDTVILLCMDKDWKNVIMSFIIPSGNILLPTICITKSKKRGVSREWIGFKVDSKPYDDAYHSLSIDNCTILKKEV